MNRASSPHSPTFSPLYRQIKGLITHSLEAGEWAPGAVIPSETELAVRFGVSQGTVRKAVDEMVADHLLVRRQGKGTFVASHNDPRNYFRFLRLAANDGELPQPQSVVLECGRAKAGADVARTLGLAPGAAIIIVRRLLRLAGEAAAFDEIYLPGALFADLTLDILSANKTSLYGLLESRYGVRMIRAEERLRAVAADRVAAAWLGVDEGSPLLLVERITYSYGDKPTEWRRGFYATHNFHYHNELV